MADLITDISLEFDVADREFSFREEITGTIVFTPAKDIEEATLTLFYQWCNKKQPESSDGEIKSTDIAIEQTWYDETIEHISPFPIQSQTPRRRRNLKSRNMAPQPDLYEKVIELFHQLRNKGQTDFLGRQPEPITIVKQQTWKKGQTYHLPFAFSIIDGPISFYGWGEKLDWIAWVELISDGKKVNSTRESTKTVFHMTGDGSDGGLWILNQEIKNNQLKKNVFLLIFSLIGLLLSSLVWSGIWNITGQVGFDGFDSVQATVSLQPRQRVFLKLVRLKIKVVEETRESFSTLNGGGFVKTTKQILYFNSNQLPMDKEVEAGDSWTDNLTVSLKADIQPTNKFTFGSKTVEINWEAEIEISQEGWPSWRKTAALQVRKTMH